MEAFPDIETIRRAAQGDNLATREVLRLLASWLPGVVARRHSEEVGREDLCQDVLIQVHRGIRTLRHAERFRAWVLGIIRNQAAERMKGERRQINAVASEAGRLSEMGQGAGAPTPERTAALREAWRIGQQAMDALDPGAREVYAMHIEGYSLTEIAGILEIPRGTAASRLSRASTIVGEQILQLAEGNHRTIAPTPDSTLEGR